MGQSRRHFLKTASLASMAWISAGCSSGKRIGPMNEFLQQPVLRTDFLKDPVVIASIELLQSGKNYLVRTRSTAGVEAITVPNPQRMSQFASIFLKNIVPTFLKKDARQLESLLWEVYRAGSNYKLQGIALWAPVAAMEMSLLELMGQTARRPVADLFGGSLRRDIAVYYASEKRGNTPEQEIEYLQKLAGQSGAKALKYRLGGRMSRNADSPPGRTEALIPLVRKTFGDSFTLYADSNSSYDVQEAIRIGRMMEAHGYAFYEEPVEFDDLWGCKQVADELKIPIAAGEQEFSLHRFRWAIENRAIDIAQPDLHYGGGFIRATQVARMAAAMGMPVVPHMSGGGLGYLDVVHFASFTPNIGPHMEFKGNTDLPIECATSSLKCEKGIVRCPTGPGFGVKVDPAFVNKCQILKA